MPLIQLTSNTGPDECSLAVAKAFKKLFSEAQSNNITVSIIEEVEGNKSGTYKSLFLNLDSTNNESLSKLINKWQGTIQWICESPYRPGHKRKNWFLGCDVFPETKSLPDSEIKFETMRSSGAGGQHVNTTDSAVRATHINTGISVKVQTERSQHMNKKLAITLLSAKLEKYLEEQNSKNKATRRLQHHQTERGNAVLTFKGMDFKEVKP